MGKPERAVAVAQPPLSLPKARTGIDGLDEITGGGLPQGRPTLVCGGPGCGKTLLAMELVEAAERFQRQMKALGSRCELFIMKGATHTQRSKEQAAMIEVEERKFLTSLGYLKANPDTR